MVVPFDLRLPGWLPPTHKTSMTNTSHGVLVRANIGYMNASAVQHSVSTRNGPPMGAFLSSSKFTEFTVRRHRFPSSIDQTPITPRDRQFTLRSDPNSASPIDCVVTVPEWIDTHGDQRSLKINLKVRARDTQGELAVKPLDSSTFPVGGSVEQPRADEDTSENGSSSPSGTTTSECSVPMEREAGQAAEDKGETSTNIVEIGMEVEEVRRYSSAPFPSFAAAYPLPAEQPSASTSEHALLSPPTQHDKVSPTPGVSAEPYRGFKTRQCLLADDGSQRNFFFADEGLPLGEAWRKVNIVLPMPGPQEEPGDQDRRGGRPRPELDSAFLRIRHNLKIRIVCRNAGAMTDTVVILSTPVRFGSCITTCPSSTKAAPLPAYVQLFHENGELRECDPLPVYARYLEQAEPLPPVPQYDSVFPSVPACSIEGHAEDPSSPPRAPSPTGSATSSTSDVMDIDSTSVQDPSTAWTPSIPGCPGKFEAISTGNAALARQSFV